MRMLNRFELLTPRERTILTHLQNGLTATEIAQGEYVGLATVRTQIQSILMKLGVNNQLAAVAVANRHDQEHWRCRNCQEVAS